MTLSARHVLEFYIYDIVYLSISRLVQRLHQTLRWLVFYLAAVSLQSSHRLGFFVLLSKLGYVLFASATPFVEETGLAPSRGECCPLCRMVRHLQ
ncbi:unnamed protein product [Musa banksii]